MLKLLRNIFKIGKNPDKEIHLRQVVQLAIDTEHRGARFYADIAGKSDNTEVKKICEKLAADETAHEDKFRMISSQWRHLPAELKYSQKLFKEFERFNIFNDIDVLKMTEEKMIEYAVIQEEKTISFYEHVEKYLPELWKQMNIHVMILQEKAHKSALETLLKAVKK